MSANLLVDLGGTGHFNPSLISTLGPQSGTVIGVPIDLGDSNTFCNVWFTTTATSGPIQIQVQCSDSPSGYLGWGGGLPPSGTFTDPTSGLAQLPTWFGSGGVLTINSGFTQTPGGGWAGSGQPNYIAGYPPGTYPFGANPVIQGQGGIAFSPSGTIPEFASGGVAFAAFQRTGQFARINLLSGGAGPASGQVLVMAGFLSQKRTTGSGAGFSWSPQVTAGGPQAAFV